MKSINYKIGNLELRLTKSLGKNPREYLEIVKWFETTDSCYTIALYEDGEESPDLKFVGDRFNNSDVIWKDFRELIVAGYKYYDNLSDDSQE